MSPIAFLFNLLLNLRNPLSQYQSSAHCSLILPLVIFIYLFIYFWSIPSWHSVELFPAVREPLCALLRRSMRWRLWSCERMKDRRGERSTGADVSESAASLGASQEVFKCHVCAALSIVSGVVDCWSRLMWLTLKGNWNFTHLQTPLCRWRLWWDSLIHTPLDSTGANNIPPKQNINRRRKNHSLLTPTHLVKLALLHTTISSFFHCLISLCVRTDAKCTYSTDGKRGFGSCFRLSNVLRCSFLRAFEGHDPAEVCKTKLVPWAICTFSLN